MGFEKKTIRRT